jgi:hypothetical protein
MRFRPTARPSLAALLLVALLGCGGDDGGGDDKSLTVSITSPTQKAYVRTSVTVQVVVDGGTATTVELLRDGATLAKLVAPYQYTWDTASVAEGTYALTARATRGNTSATSTPLEVVVDRTPPSLESRHPVGAAEWDGAISFTATEPLAASSVNDSGVRLLEDAVEIRKKLQLSADGKTVRVVVNQPLELPSSMSLQLLPLMTDLAGNPLSVPVSGWTWSAPRWRLLGRTPVQPGHGAGYMQTSLVVDAEGQPIVSFEELEDIPVGQPITPKVALARWSGGAWERISPPADANGQGQLAVDGTGRLHLAWAAAQSLSVSRWNGSAWTPVPWPIPRQTPGIVDRAMRLAVTPDGTPMVAWHMEDGPTERGDGYIFGMRDGILQYYTAWTPARVRALEMSPTSFPWVALSWSSGTPFSQVFAWNGTGFRNVGGSLEEAAGSAFAAEAMDLDFDAQGRAYVAWRASDRIVLQRWNGERWEYLSSRQAPGGISSDEEIALAVTPEGRAYIAWTYRSHPAPAELRLDYWNGSFMEPVITGMLAEPFGGVALALDSAGRPVVAWVAPAPLGSHRPTLQVRANH